MGTGIIVCGLNGAGKSTLGRALAKELQFRFIDNEDLYFPKNNPQYLFASPRSHEEVEELLLREIQTHENFVFASVKGDYGEVVSSHFRYAVLIEVPKEIRMQRVRERSFQKFGERMLPGGDLYETEEAFFAYVGSRAENTVEEWLKTLHCPILRVDGTKPIEENVRCIAMEIQQ